LLLYAIIISESLRFETLFFPPPNRALRKFRTAKPLQSHARYRTSTTPPMLRRSDKMIAFVLMRQLRPTIPAGSTNIRWHRAHLGTIRLETPVFRREIMEEQWLVDRAKLRQLLHQHPAWSTRHYAAAVGRSQRWAQKWKQRLQATDLDDQQVLHSQSRARKTTPERYPLRLLSAFSHCATIVQQPCLEKWAHPRSSTICTRTSRWKLADTACCAPPARPAFVLSPSNNKTLRW